MTIHHTDETSAEAAVQRALMAAKEEGKWMALVFCVNDRTQRLEMLTRTTWQFPHADVGRALDLAKDSFRVEIASPPPPETPLPPASLEELIDDALVVGVEEPDDA